MNVDVQVGIHQVPVECFERLANVFEVRESDGVQWVVLETPQARVSMFRAHDPFEASVQEAGDAAHHCVAV